jgi:hypothetical protein
MFLSATKIGKCILFGAVRYLFKWGISATSTLTYLFIILLILLGARVLLTGDEPGEKSNTETITVTN